MVVERVHLGRARGFRITRSVRFVVLALFALESVRCGQSASSNSDSSDDGTGGDMATGGASTGGSATGGSATGGSATGGSATGGSATGGDGTGGTGGTAGGGDVCADATPMQPCSTEGETCGACDSPCNFCNIMRCVSGVWQRFEAPPAPCFDCGASLRCQSYETYCRIERGAALVEECVPVPTECDTNVTCMCIGPLNAPSGCSGDEGEITVERSGG